MTTASGLAILSEYGLLHRGDNHLLTVKEVLHFWVAVQNAVAIELQESPLKGRSQCIWARLGRGVWSDWEGIPRWESRLGSLHVRGLCLSRGCCRWDQGRACEAAPQRQLPVICCGTNSDAVVVVPQDSGQTPYTEKQPSQHPLDATDRARI